jgi:hypothetical protein
MTAVRNLIAAMFAVALLMTTGGCEFNVSTANIQNAQMAKGVDEQNNPVDPTTVFSTSDNIFYCVAELGNAPDGTHVKAVWKVIKAEGAKPDQVIVEKEVQAGGNMNKLQFSMTVENPLPPGDYRCDLYLNPKSDGSSKPEKSLPFTIK